MNTTSTFWPCVLGSCNNAGAGGFFLPHLIVTEPGRVAVAVPLSDGFRVGRHEQNDLVLSDFRVSRQHIRFTCTARGWEVTDLGSTQGMLVNGAKVGARTLQDRDRIQIGGVLLTFHAEDEVPSLVDHRISTTKLPLWSSKDADRRLRLIQVAARAVGAASDTEGLLSEMLDGIIDLFGCERALVGLCEDPRGPIRRILRRRSAASGQDDVVVSRSLLEAMLVRREGVLLRNAKNAPRTVVREHILCAMGVPLQTATRLFGFLYVDDREQAERFTHEDLDFLSAIGYLTGAALENAERYQRAAALAEALGDESPTAEIIGRSPPMEQLRSQIIKYGAALTAHVLVRGESGTGKELVARALHAASPREGHPFVTLNCAAIPESMVESELFGYEKGAFTGAVKDKRGKFALASGGTLFLDEIGDLNSSAQAKVLRAIQEGEIQPLGSEKTMRVDVRIVAATHKDLRGEIVEKRFREDLYYRLAVVELELPPLRSREGDVPLLAEALLRTSASAMGKRLGGFTPAALAALSRYPWPGNVRELRNEVERAAINAEGAFVELSDLSSVVRGAGPSPPPAPRATPQPEGTLAERFAALEPLEKQLVEEALARAKGNVSEAARLLGITRMMMRRRVEKLGLTANDD